MKKFLALILALTMVFSLAACSSSSDEEEVVEEDVVVEMTDMEYVQDKGVLVVGITDFAPMDYKEDGEWVGFDADMAKGFAEYLGVDVEFVEIEWGSKILEVNAMSIDCVWNGMTLTDEVMSAMDCSVAYCNNAQIVIVNADVADDYQTVESLTDLVFAVEDGSAGMAAAEDLGLTYTAVLDQATALMEVAAGSCDAAIIDSLMAAAMVGEGTSYSQLTYTVGLTTEEYGVAFRQGSDLVDALNTYFADCIADGTMLAIAETYGVEAAIITE